MYIKAIQRLNFEKEEVMIVEDSPVGLEAANKSGALVCQIKDPYDIEKVILFLNSHNQK